MAKIDLLQNEDFRAYQEDIKSRWEANIRRLDEILGQPLFTVEYEMMLHAQRAVCKEYEAIMKIPYEYAINEAAKHKDAGDNDRAAECNRKAGSIWDAINIVKLHMWKRALGGNNA